MRVSKHVEDFTCPYCQIINRFEYATIGDPDPDECRDETFVMPCFRCHMQCEVNIALKAQRYTVSVVRSRRTMSA